MNQDIVVEIKDLSTDIGGKHIHKNINLSIQRGEIFVIVGGSGSGKTVLLREMLGLRRPTQGSIRILDSELMTATSAELLALQRRFGVLFQQNALFSSLTVLENVAFPLKEHTKLDQDTIRQLALLKIVLAGLPADSANKYPAELSGGMQKRAALARAIVLDPELIFLDEPTSGLDPCNVIEFDRLILTLQSTMDLTIVMVTHDVDSLKRVGNRVAFLCAGSVLSVETPADLMKNPNPQIQEFFYGPQDNNAHGY